MEVTQVTRVAAYGVILHQRRILLCRLSSIVPKHAGKWTLPGGGMEFGEHPEDTVVREVLEETGLQVRVGTVLGVNAFAFEEPERHYHSVRIVYRAEWITGDLTFETDGSTDRCEWFRLDDVGELPTVGLVDFAVPRI